LAIDVDRTSTTLGNAAAKFGACEAEDFSNDPQQGHLWLRVHFLDFAVHIKGIHAHLLHLDGDMTIQAFCSFSFDLLSDGAEFFSQKKEAEASLRVCTHFHNSRLMKVS
jgi:hypothetical protein